MTVTINSTFTLTINHAYGYIDTPWWSAFIDFTDTRHRHWERKDRKGASS